jgi:CubicO group peptidase (beta-lactamase class C family)
MRDNALPGTDWEVAEPTAAGLDAAALDTARGWLEENAGELPFRVVVVRGGRIVAEWERGVATDQQLGIASAGKSLFSCALAIAVADGKIGSPDDLVVDYYPEMMDVPEGRGPKPGRFAKPEDAGITFRHLISNSSGYMKPGEAPGAVFHYQTFGMNILAHAIAAQYGLYDSAAPENTPGIGALVEERIRNPIGGTWGYSRSNFEHTPDALTRIFGNFTTFRCTARDMARIGFLWLHGGRWGEQQVIPEGWVAEATSVARDIRASCPEEEWCYGLGFWTNECRRLWPSLPHDSFAASGAGRQHIWVCPSLDAVVVQSPGIFETQRDEDDGLLRRLLPAFK